MTITIAVAGKGGTGKTTFSCLMLRHLIQTGQIPVLAVDADPDANLATGVGRPNHGTIGQVLDDWLKNRSDIPSGMSKQQMLEMRFHQAIEEASGFDLLAMGRPEGPGCYCSANAVLRDFLERLADNYKVVILDNEAGMEHMSRRTAGTIDHLVMVSDPTRKGLRTVQGLLDLVKELELPIRNKALVISRASKIDPSLEGVIQDMSVKLLGLVPQDQAIVSADLQEASLLDLPDDSPAVAATEKIMVEMLNK